MVASRHVFGDGFGPLRILILGHEEGDWFLRLSDGGILCPQLPQSNKLGGFLDKWQA